MRVLLLIMYRHNQEHEYILLIMECLNIIRASVPRENMAAQVGSF